MVEFNSEKYRVKNGDCAWNVAKKHLKSQGKKATSAEISKEMQRLAKLNGCDSVEDFNTKYFSKIGSEFVYEQKASAPQKNRPVQKVSVDTLQKDSAIARQDNTRVAMRDTLPVNTNNKVDTTKVVKKKYKAPKVSSEQAEISNINKINGDVNKIVAYNKKHAKGNYLIIDKKTCKATVYNKDGKVLKSYEVLLGSHRGDNLSKAYAKDPSERTYTTVPGEYKFTSESGTFGGLLRMGESRSTGDPDVVERPDAPGSGGKKKMGAWFQALHGTANPAVRNKYYGNGKLSDNRQSMGCVNIPVDALKELQNKYGIGVGSNCYILPEDKGNKLILQKQKDGTVKFVTHYADKKQNDKLARVNNAIANKNIQRTLAAKKKAEQQRLLAEQQKQEEFSILRPSTWFS